MMREDYIPDWNCALRVVPYSDKHDKAKDKGVVKFYLFLSDAGTFVVRHELHQYRKDPSKNWERKDRLGFFWNIQSMLPEEVVEAFKAELVNYSIMAMKEIR